MAQALGWVAVWPDDLRRPRIPACHDGWRRDRRHHHQSDNLRHSDWCRIGL